MKLGFILLKGHAGGALLTSCSQVTYLLGMLTVIVDMKGRPNQAEERAMRVQPLGDVMGS